MTCIAYRAGTMAGDKLYGSEWLKVRHVTKIFVASGHLIGLSGSARACMEFLSWIRAGARPEKFPEVCAENNSVHALVVDRHGKIRLFESSPAAFEIENEYVAIGSGQDAATAAMYLGETAVAAVQVANAICNGCGGGIDVLRLEDIDAAQD